MVYIRKEDLINKIKPEQKDDYEHFISIANVRKILRNFVESVAEVDAVEVVRCEDCVYYEAEECVCPYIWMSDGAHLWTGVNDFCSYGERREDG